MAHSYEEDDEDKATLLDFKQNLNTYSIKRLRRLANVLIDSMIQLTSKRESMNAEFENQSETERRWGRKCKSLKNKWLF